MSGLVGNSRRHIFSWRGSNTISAIILLWLYASREQYQYMYIHSWTTVCHILGSLSMYRWLHFCKYHRHRHPLYLCTINSSEYRHLEITWMGLCISWRFTTQWNAFWTNTRQIVNALLHISSINSRLHPAVFSVLMFENLRFSTSSIFLVFAFQGMCVISVLQDTHFQKDAIIYFSETSAAVSQPLRV